MALNKLAYLLVMFTTLFTSIGFAQDKLSLENWIRMQVYVAAQEDQVIKFSEANADGSIKEIFFANSEIGILIGQEIIRKDKSGNIETVMWHFVASEDALMNRYLRRIVVKNTENVVTKIQTIDSTDSENRAKFEEIKVELYDSIVKSLRSKKSSQKTIQI